MDIKHYIDAGYRCPFCKSKKLRCCYHDHQTLDSWVCGKCGMRWHEDVGMDDYPKDVNQVKDFVLRQKEMDMFVWVLHKKKNLEPIQDSRSSDGVGFADFGEDNKL